MRTSYRRHTMVWMEVKFIVVFLFSVNSALHPAGCRDAFLGSMGFRRQSVECHISLENFTHTNYILRFYQEKGFQDMTLICTSVNDSNSINDIRFPPWPSLRNLRMLYCPFHRIPPSYFKNISQLENLHFVEGNKINNEIQSNFSAQALKGLDKLNTFALSRVDMDTIPPTILCYLPNLKTLKLSFRKFQRFVEWFGLSGSSFNECLLNIAVLDIGKGYLEAIPKLGRLPKLETLMMASIGVKGIETNAFNGLDFLRNIDIFDNNITHLPDNLFSHISKLVRIDLSYNKLSTIPHFDNNNVRVINVSSNILQNIAVGDLKNLQKLEILELSYNEITTIDDNSFQNLTNIREINLERNKLLVINERIFNGLSNLKILNMNGNHLKSLKANAFVHFTKIQHLYVNINSLETLPFLGNFSNLVSIDISGNIFSECPRITSKSLLDFKISNNTIVQIEKLDFLGTPNLEIIDLSSNRIRVIEHNAFGSLLQLKELKLEKNNITSISGVANSSLNLKVFIASFNYITEFDYAMIPTSLLHLTLDHNLIVKFTDSYNKLSSVQLKFINLSYNKIKILPHFFIPEKCEALHLNNNEISAIGNDALNHLIHLKYVNLKGNKIKHLDPTDLYVNKYNDNINRVLHLSDNPFVCDCNLPLIAERARKSFSEFKIVDFSEMKCELPLLRPKQWKLISLLNKSDDTLCELDTLELNSLECLKFETRNCRETCTKCKCYKDRSWSYSYSVIDCRGRNLSSVPDSFPIKAAKIYLENNRIPVLNNNSFGNQSRVVSLFLSNSEIEVLMAGTFSTMSSLGILFLDGNKLKHLPRGLFNGLANLREVYLHKNHIYQVGSEVFHPVSNTLLVLTLHENMLRNWSELHLEEISHFSNITLGHNEWSCECDLSTPFIEWIHNRVNEISDIKNVSCTDGANTTYLMINLNTTRCLEAATYRIDNASNSLEIIVGILCTFVLLSGAGIATFMFRKELQVYVYSRYGVRIFHESDECDVDKEYDAFISYNALDENFVTETLSPGLEGITPPYRLCINHRDFAPGAFITESILEAVEKSRRTIIVVSENFIKSELCRFEFKTAHMQMVKDRRKRVIVVLLGEVPSDLDPEMQLYFKTNTYLEWGNRWFWKRLYYAMPDRGDGAVISRSD